MHGTICDTQPARMAPHHALAANSGAHRTEQDRLPPVGYPHLAPGAYTNQRMGHDPAPAEIVDELLDGVISRVRKYT
jgi:hypothetical protein